MSGLQVDPNAVFDTLGRHMLVDGFHLVMDLEKSHGSWIVDARDGRKYLDFYTFFATAPLGHNHPRLREATFVQRLGEIAVNKPANSDIYTTAFAEWVEAFGTHAAPDYLPHLFWIDGGALAVENALKAAFDWKVRKNLAAGKGEKGSQVIHFREAFHGRTGYTLSLTNTKPVKTWGYPKFRWTRLPAPNDGEEASLAVAQNALERGNVAAVIVEPIQGEGGDIHFRPQYLQGLRSLARKYDALFIVDEVQTGVGLTGKMWGYEHFDLQPDLMCFGKKTQVCGCCATHKVDEVTKHVFNDSGRINSTWGGNILDMIRFTILSEIIVREKWVENAAKVGDYLLDKLRNANVPIRNVRGRGLMIAFDPIDQGEAYCRLSDRMLMLKSGDRSIRLRPPLTFSMEDADEAVKIIASL